MARENLSDTSHEELAKARGACIEEDATKDLRSALGKPACIYYVAPRPEVSQEISKSNAIRTIAAALMSQTLPYQIRLRVAGQLLGERYYFTAPIMEQETSELVVFSLSPTIGWSLEWMKMDHFTTIISTGPPIQFSQFSFGSVHLYMRLEEAREFAQSNNPPVSSNYTPECPPLIDDNGTSPPSPASVPTVSGTCIVFCAGYFGQSPDQKVIDQWVDHAVTTHQAARDGINLKCPEMGCKASSRRPHALKTHLYTHYGIKPHSCAICNISVLTEANLSRHMKNIHTCPGCLFVAPVVS
ncbi:hypothetical protein RHS01_10305 [Rhizoctonia solani]|uniref:C2H2-type domain-containing protein n=1 Tax=Rhizoctonia solani TaxID=456999 RepID=A0A8H7M081_9AGAM|nr:hypothetical protein RHS01_10305 [Rhizoctonia solani]